MMNVLRNLKKEDQLITSRLDLWLVRNPELVLTQDDLDLIKRLMEPRGSRVGTFTGSQAGTCERRQMFNYIGLPQMGRVDPVLINRFMDGTWRHVRWMIILRKAIPGLKVEVRVDSQLFRGSFDLVHLRERWAGEIKGTLLFSKMIREGIFPAHEQQAARYLLAADEDNFPHLDKFTFFYEDKGRNNYREIVVNRDPKLEHYVESELRRLKDAATERELPPILSECVRGRGEFFHECPYSHVCLKLNTWREAEQCAKAPDSQGSPRKVAERKVRPTGVGVPKPVRKVAKRSGGRT
jgi:hypothetical protein